MLGALRTPPEAPCSPPIYDAAKKETRKSDSKMQITVVLPDGTEKKASMDDDDTVPNAHARSP